MASAQLYTADFQPHRLTPLVPADCDGEDICPTPQEAMAALQALLDEFPPGALVPAQPLAVLLAAIGG